MLTLPRPVDAKQLKLGVERFTSREPYALVVEAKAGDVWQMIWEQGEKTATGTPYLVAPAKNPDASASQVRFRCTSNLGAIIVDMPDAWFNGFFND